MLVSSEGGMKKPVEAGWMARKIVVIAKRAIVCQQSLVFRRNADTRIQGTA
ncbi:MAG: hypothetical protein FWF31_12690 [Desulfobulbus sp.]|nr:hypothetical protein [Desulfobulbus sp.]